MLDVCSFAVPRHGTRELTVIAVTREDVDTLKNDWLTDNVHIIPMF